MPKLARELCNPGDSSRNDTASVSGRAEPLKILMTTEGTYPFAVGGVSSVCHLLISNTPEIEWNVLPIVSGGRVRRPRFEPPDNALFLPVIDLWSRSIPRIRWPSGNNDESTKIPARLLAGVMEREPDLDDLVDALVWCRLHDGEVQRAFSSSEAWDGFVSGLKTLEDQPALNMARAAQLYQRLYWVARAASVRTPAADVVHVTAAGLACVPAVVDKAVLAVPVVVTEHGIYSRESYLEAVRGTEPLSSRWISTRFATGLARLAYHAADVVAPVTAAHGHWERWLGTEAAKIKPIYNGVEPSEDPLPPPRAATVVIVGRIDPLKDVLTMLRVAAEVVRTVRNAQFLHFGMAGDDQQGYQQACEELHRRLGLGSAYRFMGLTDSPRAEIRAGDLVLLTSISEGVPMAILEGMAEARPVVATSVGGVDDLVRGCGLTAAPGDIHGLASAVRTLLREPDLAERLGQRGYTRLRRRFTEETFLKEYRDIFGKVARADADHA